MTYSVIDRIVICKFCLTQVLQTDEFCSLNRSKAHTDCLEESIRIQNAQVEAEKAL